MDILEEIIKADIYYYWYLLGIANILTWILIIKDDRYIDGFDIFALGLMLVVPVLIVLTFPAAICLRLGNILIKNPFRQ